MNPCDICGDRIMVYGGVCEPCKKHRTEMAATQWRPSYDAATARLETTPGLEAGFGADFTGNIDKLSKKRKKSGRQTGVT